MKHLFRIYFLSLSLIVIGVGIYLGINWNSLEPIHRKDFLWIWTASIMGTYLFGKEFIK